MNPSETDCPDSTIPAEPTYETLIIPSSDVEVLHNMSCLLDPEIVTLNKEEIITFLQHYATKYRSLTNPTQYDTSDTDKLRNQLKTHVLQLRHHYVSIPPQFLSHFTTNEQLTKMSMTNDMDLLQKHAENHTIQLDTTKLDKYSGIDLINECKRIRDDLRKLEGLPAIVDPRPQPKPAPKPPSVSDFRNKFRQQKNAANLNGSVLDGHLSSSSNTSTRL